MKHDPARNARRALLGLVALVTLAVAWSLLRPDAPITAPSPPPLLPGSGTTVQDLVFLRFEDESRKVEIKARERVGQQGDAVILRGVEATFPFRMQGRASTLTIRADECQYQPALERAAYKGHVRLRTEDGFELETDSLKYWGDKQRAFTRDPLRFKRGAVSGTATGLEYRVGSGILLQDSVRMRIEDAAGPATEVESQSATGSREERLVVFSGAVLVRQGPRELRTQRLRLETSEDMEVVERAVATGDVDFVTGSGPVLPGSAAQGGASKRLRSQRLDVAFRAKGILRQALASGAASLEVEPGPLGPRERRKLVAQRLRFDFDELGRLFSVAGLPGTGAPAGAGRRVVLSAEPLSSSSDGARRVESDVFEAALDPVTGEVKRAEFEGSVVFSEPGRKAWAGHSSYDPAAGTLVLTGDPRIADEAEGSELRGRQIRIGTRTRAVSASGNVRHSIAPKQAAERPGLFGGKEPTVLVCREFDFDPETRSARYRDNALLRSGSDEVRAPLITLDDPGPKQRRMRASGGQSSVLHPRPAKGKAKQPAAVEARSREMLYEEAQSRIVYTGDVEIRQGDILTRSPEAIAMLAPEGGELERLLAGAPVEVRQGARRADGERGVYTPSNETFVLTGEKVVLHDVDRRLEGRILSFEVGSDRIRVDGREEVRTEAVFRRKEPAKP